MNMYNIKSNLIYRLIWEITNTKPESVKKKFNRNKIDPLNLSGINEMLTSYIIKKHYKELKNGQNK